MTPKELTDSIAILINQYEEQNNQSIVGCFVYFNPKITYEWDGEKFQIDEFSVRKSLDEKDK